MARLLHHIHSFTIRNDTKRRLAFSWILGLGAGGLAFRYTGDSIVSLMPLALSSQLSIVSLILISVLPFLLAAFAVFISSSRLLRLICFSKAFCCAYVASAAVSFTSGGWLIRWLLLFTDTWACMLLYFYVRRHSAAKGYFSFGEVFLFCGMVSLAAALDYSYISPFLRQLLS